MLLIGPPALQSPAGAGKPPPANIARKSILASSVTHYSTLLPTGNPLIDLFFSPPELLTHRLGLASNYDPQTTLKLICSLSGSDKEGFYTAAFWLHQNHPLILACNLRLFASFGSLKDPLKILSIVLEGLEEERRIKKEERERLEEVRRRFRRIQKETRESTAKSETAEGISKAIRKEREIARAKRAIKTYRNDPDYRYLHDRISDLFVEFLKTDLEHLKSGDIKKISLAAKWCPSIDSSYDKSTLICESIARKIFPRESIIEYKGIEEAHYAYRVRDRLRKQVLVPLRKALESENERDCSTLRRRNGGALKKTYKKLFTGDDDERFRVYLQIAAKGRNPSVGGEGSLLPHQLISSLNAEQKVAEIHWRRLIEDLLKNEKLKNSTAICDVSKSMREMV